jgi:hypothetical protein
VAVILAEPIMVTAKVFPRVFAVEVCEGEMMPVATSMQGVAIATTPELSVNTIVALAVVLAVKAWLHTAVPQPDRLAMLPPRNGIPRVSASPFFRATLRVKLKCMTVAVLTEVVVNASIEFVASGATIAGDVATASGTGPPAGTSNFPGFATFGFAPISKPIGANAATLTTTVKVCELAATAVVGVVKPAPTVTAHEVPLAIDAVAATKVSLVVG